MYNGIFIIPSALIAKPSVSPKCSNEERYEQSLDTLKSIDKYCPNSLKLVVDVSYTLPEQFKIDEMVKLGAVYINGSENETVEPGLGNILETRLWHLDFSLLENFKEKINKILQDLLNGANCIELSFYNNLQNEKLTYVSPIGSEGKMGFFGNYLKE